MCLVLWAGHTSIPVYFFSYLHTELRGCALGSFVCTCIYVYPAFGENDNMNGEATSLKRSSLQFAMMR